MAAEPRKKTVRGNRKPLPVSVPDPSRNGGIYRGRLGPTPGRIKKQKGRDRQGNQTDRNGLQAGDIYQCEAEGKAGMVYPPDPLAAQRFPGIRREFYIYSLSNRIIAYPRGDQQSHYRRIFF